MLLRKKTCLKSLVMIMCLAFSAFSSLSAQKKQIDKLNFLYKKGYKVHFSGERINYDYYNFPQSKQASFLEYDMTGDRQKGKEDVQGFTTTQDDGKDTVSYSNYLYINDDGMFFWVWDDKKKVKQKNKTQAISLPLRAGKTWDTYYDNFSAKLECVSVDSVIKTPIGDLNTFVVTTTYIDHSKKEYDQEATITDFYNEELGQVRKQISYAALPKKEGGIKKKLFDVTLSADKMIKP